MSRSRATRRLVHCFPFLLGWGGVRRKMLKTSEQLVFKDPIVH